MSSTEGCETQGRGDQQQARALQLGRQLAPRHACTCPGPELDACAG